MAFGKLVCGLWLVRIEVSSLVPAKLKATAKQSRLPRMAHFWGATGTRANPTASTTQYVPDRVTINVSVRSSSQPEGQSHDATADESTRAPSDHQSPRPRNPISLYPATILGTAMVARGEIGFLISSIAESKGIFSSTSDATEVSQMFLIITWAIVLCTVIGPLCVGLLVRRVKYLEAGAEKDGRTVRADVLGVWGVG